MSTHSHNLAILRDNGFGIFASGTEATTDARLIRVRTAKGKSASYAAHATLALPASVKRDGKEVATLLNIAADIKARPFNDGAAHIGILVNNETSDKTYIDGGDIASVIQSVGAGICTIRYSAGVPKGDSSAVVGDGTIIVRGNEYTAIFAVVRFRIDDDALDAAFNPEVRTRTRTAEVVNDDDLLALI